MTIRLKSGVEILRYLGPRWVAYRIWHALDERSGSIQKRLRAGDWKNSALLAGVFESTFNDASQYDRYRRENAPGFFFHPSDFTGWSAWLSEFDRGARPSVAETADEVGRGIFRIFSHRALNAGFPPNWLQNIQTGQVLEGGVHFSEIKDFQSGDIKGVWELNRFSFVFPLVRAFARVQDESYAEIFWQLFESWLEQNPPNAGPNWKCGQETAFRVMAWIFALYAFAHCRATTADRVQRIAIALAASGERIQKHIRYALSQDNNHGVSEAVGLYTLGLLFPELRGASAWKEAGARYLEKLGRRLIYKDGAFAQNSFNYQRLALHDFLWALRLGEIHSRPFSTELKERVCRMANLLFEAQDPVSGQLPNYGHNDGAQLLQLTNCGYPDFRPVLQAACYFETERLGYAGAVGPWNEETLWLFGVKALSAPKLERSRKPFAVSSSGYCVLRAGRSFGFIRYPKFCHRPSQADLLHFDLWFEGENIAGDPGTFSYNAPEPWREEFERTRHHNTISLGSRDQMRKASRFLWLPWPQSVIRYQKSSKALAYLEGEHLAYAPAKHRRAVIRLPEEVWAVCDTVTECNAETVRLHWLFPNSNGNWSNEEKRLDLVYPGHNYFFHLAVPGVAPEVSLVVGDPASARGWISRHYFDKQPALSFAASLDGPEVFFCSIFAPKPWRIESSEERILIRSDDSSITLITKGPGDGPIVQSVLISSSGSREEISLS